jgi:response regulator RpfG family c-di-GMP phosphodiesterase
LNRTILYVDDEVDNLAVFEMTFEGQFKVLTAASAEEALGILERMLVPVVVSDQRMPGTTGVQLFSILRSKYPHTQRVLLTGYTEPEAMKDAINLAHVFYYLNKPWEYSSLEEILLRAIETYDLRVSLEEQSRLLLKQNDELRAIQATLERVFELHE